MVVINEPFFVAKNVADILEYSETAQMTKRLDEDEKADIPFWNVSSKQICRFDQPMTHRLDYDEFITDKLSGQVITNPTT